MTEMIGKTYKSRLKNSRRNVVSGFVKQIVAIILTFIIRTTIIFSLGAEYQGLSSLFTSILHALNLTELGFSAAVTYVLYKPIAEEDYATICSILAFLKKTYRIIGAIILLIGLMIMPFLKLLIKGDYPHDINIYVLYLLFLANSVVSYLVFAEKNTFLTAMQRVDIVSKAYTVANIAGKILQVLALIVIRNFYVYVVMIIIASIANNILVEILSRKSYPNIKAYGNIPDGVKTELIKHVKAVFLNKIGDAARNSFDNSIISSFIGLAAVTAYDNYYYVFASIYGVMGMIVHSVRASIGNSLVNESVDKNYKDLLSFSFIFMWIVGWCTISMFVLYQPFMYIWMKGDEELILCFRDMALFCLYFYTISMAYTKNAYLESEGLFFESRWLYVLEAVGNLVLNIVLCHLLGTTGILIATIFTIFIFNFAGGTGVLFKYYFKRKPNKFTLHHLFYFFITVFGGLLTYAVSEYITVGGIYGLFLKAVLCLFLPNIIYLLCYFKFSEFSNIKRIVGLLIR